MEVLAQYDSRKSHGTAWQLQAMLGHHPATVTMKYYVQVQEVRRASRMP
jgi:hypothetical protein